MSSAHPQHLVSAEMTEETFWKRFFFRVHQIQREEEKRKALLQGIYFTMSCSYEITQE
jgi:hypothetical protein